MADDDKKLRKVAITNNDRGPRFIYANGGQQVFRAGETRTVTMTGAELKSLDDEIIDGTDDAPRWSADKPGKADASGGNGDDSGKALADMTVSQLRQIATAEGVALSNRGKAEDGTTDLPDLKSAADIIAAIEAKRAADNPPNA